MNTWNFSIKLIKKIRMKPINISESIYSRTIQNYLSTPHLPTTYQSGLVYMASLISLPISHSYSLSTNVMTSTNMCNKHV